jgi:hypothetical protein
MMSGASFVIDDACAADKIRSIKRRVFALNPMLPVRRQRLVYSAGPHGIDALADDETLGGAGVAQDGTAVLDVLLADLTAAEAHALGSRVRNFLHTLQTICHLNDANGLSSVCLCLASFLFILYRQTFACLPISKSPVGYSRKEGPSA